MAELALALNASRTHRPSDARGAVYVEFLLAFIPLFVFFLGICQLALLSAARVVVGHSAQQAVRSAVVVLDDDPDYYDAAPRGYLTMGAVGESGIDALLTALRVPGSGLIALTPHSSSATHDQGPLVQRGTRMLPIRAAVYSPLLVLASAERARSGSGVNVAASLADDFATRLRASATYTRAASVVTVHDDPKSVVPAAEPIAPDAEVTVRVTYLYQCSIPVVRSLICRSLASLLADDSPLGVRFQQGEAPGAIWGLGLSGGRFYPLTAEATLPNQGARYHEESG